MPNFMASETRLVSLSLIVGVVKYGHLVKTYQYTMTNKRRPRFHLLQFPRKMRHEETKSRVDSIRQVDGINMTGGI